MIVMIVINDAYLFIVITISVVIVISIITFLSLYCYLFSFFVIFFITSTQELSGSCTTKFVLQVIWWSRVPSPLVDQVCICDSLI